MAKARSLRPRTMDNALFAPAAPNWTCPPAIATQAGFAPLKVTFLVLPTGIPVVAKKRLICKSALEPPPREAQVTLSGSFCAAETTSFKCFQGDSADTINTPG